MSDHFEETWFYAPLEALGEEIELPKEEAHHMSHVLRVKAGRSIVVTNGRGRVFRCETRDWAGKINVIARECLVIQDVPPRMRVVLGLLKGRDSEEPVEGTCQLDVAAIHLVTTEHTLEFKGQEHSRLLERLNQKSVAALKQAKKAWLTAIHAPIPLRKWRENHPGNLVLSHPGADSGSLPLGESLYLLIGPEGGFSNAEIRWLKEKEGAFTMSLGTTRIRGTHAPLVAIGKWMGLESP